MGKTVFVLTIEKQNFISSLGWNGVPTTIWYNTTQQFSKSLHPYVQYTVQCTACFWGDGDVYKQ